MSGVVVLSEEDANVLRRVIAKERSHVQNNTTHQPSRIATVKNRRIAKTEGEILKGTTGDVAFYDGLDKGNELNTLTSTEAYNRFGDIEADKWVFVEFVLGGWEIYQGECG